MTPKRIGPTTLLRRMHKQLIDLKQLREGGNWPALQEDERQRLEAYYGAHLSHVEECAREVRDDWGKRVDQHVAVLLALVAEERKVVGYRAIAPCAGCGAEFAPNDLDTCPACGEVINWGDWLETQ